MKHRDYCRCRSRGGTINVREAKGHVDEVVILENPSPFYAVSQGYESFRNLSDEEVLASMDIPNNRPK